jgi:carboxypeptidase PM20D1
MPNSGNPRRCWPGWWLKAKPSIDIAKSPRIAMFKRLGWGLLALVLVLVTVLAVNTLRKGSRQLKVEPLAVLAVDEAAVSARLAEAVRLKTISSREDAHLNADEFKKQHALLEARFPRLHTTLKREVMPDLSLLYTWEGSQPNAKAVLLLAHQDVVAIAPGTEASWTQPPFAGAVKDGFIWGRGAWDNKGNLMAQLEAIEMLVASGYKPQRTVYLVMGADEEIGGFRGAAQIGKLLKSRKVQLEWVLDEGLLVTDGILPGIAQPLALVGIAEKGYQSVVLKFSTAPGHSSMPPQRGTTAIGMMSAALKRIDDDQFPAGIRGVAADMFNTVAPEMTGFSRVALSNLWLFGPVVLKQLDKGGATSAMLRTTTALTIVNAGNKDNVLPGVAEATINFRTLPGDTQEMLMQRLRGQVTQAAGTDKFELYAIPGAEASKVTPTESAQYALVNKTIREVFSDAIVAPGLMLGGTDSIHFGDISDHIFKFSPIRAKPADLPRFHGTNERIAISNYAEAIRFYHRLVSEGAKSP